MQKNKSLLRLFYLIGLIFVIDQPAQSLGYLPISFNQLKLLLMSSQPDTGINKNQISADTPTLVSSQFSFTEGPAADKEGNIFFTDQPNNKIWKYDINGKLSLFMDGTGRSNGLFFDEDGNIISCADEHNQLWLINPDKKVSILVKDFNGKAFNGPNDVWVNHINGGIYFTDPYYDRDYWKEGHTHMNEQRVYYLAKNKNKVTIADDELKKPNGIIGTPDGKYLYVADIEGDKTYKYNINTDGSLSNKQLFTNKGSDGMTIDDKGNIYLTGKGVTVFNQKGQEIKHFDIPEDWTGNICFGGKDKNILFITASKSIYIVHMNVHGIHF